MKKKQSVISIYLPSKYMDELNRITNYKRITAGEYVKQRIIAILDERLREAKK